MLLARAIVLVVGCYLITVTGKLPSSCLTSLTTSNSVQCCRAQPFLEIAFKLRFGCNVPHHFDEGVRLEIRIPDSRDQWSPIRYYTPTLEEPRSSVRLVSLNDDNITVEAEALMYRSVFPLEVVEGNQTLLIREYVCGDSFLSSNVNIRWMQRYNETSVAGVSTWSLDDVVIVVWNGECRHEVLNLVFDDNSTIADTDKYDIRAGNIEIPSCDLTGNKQLYFNEEANSQLTARRSISILNLPVASSSIECPTGSMPNVEQCDVEECRSGNNVCSIGNIQCTDCIGLGYQLPANSTVGSCLDINECEESSNSCDQQCVNSLGSYYCECDSGYTLSSDGFICTDFDECEDSSSDVCEQHCNNTLGSFECGCFSGYSLSVNGIHCEDVNECNESVNTCDQICLNTNGSFQCVCQDGFTLADDMQTCLDIDECSVLQHGCQYLCTNTMGSYVCDCFDGFRLSSDNQTCTDINECVESPTCSQLCTNTNGSYQCGCREGFTLLPHGTCQEIADIPQEVAFRRLLDLQYSLSVGNLSSTEIANLLNGLVSYLIEAGVTAPHNLSVMFSETVDDILTSVDTKGGMDNQTQASVSSILSVLDRFALEVYDDGQPGLETRGFELQVMSVHDSDSSGRIEGIRQGANQITLPVLEGGVKIASFFFKDLSSALPEDPRRETGNRLKMMIPVISSSVLCDGCDVSNLEEPVQYQLALDNSDEVDPGCYFYDLKLHDWSSDGCTVNNLTNSSVVVCDCTHLTHFAILLSPKANFSDLDSFRLQIIGYVGVSVSLFFLLLTILALTLVRSLWGMRNFIHVNLCISLFVAQLIFVTAVDKSYSDVLCQSVAVVLHYVFLVTFMWMLMEGVVLYIVLVQVFVKKQRLYMLAFTLVSYGVPLVYLAIVVPLGLVLRGSDNRPHYGYEACWLRYDTGFIWAFIAPVILIIIVNIGFFTMAIYIMRKHTKRQTQNSHLKSLVQWLKSSVVLVISMGIPWIVGVLIFTEELVFLAYIYTIFVSFQGLVIFILFVPFSKQVREGYKKWWRGKVSESDFLSKHFSSSDMDRKSSILGRFSSMRTSTFRMSRHDKSTFSSSHAEDNDTKLPDSPKEKISLSPSQSPPPAYEQYIVQSQKVVSVGNGSVDPEKHTEGVNGSISAHQKGSAVNSQIELLNNVTCDRDSMAEVQTMKFSDSASNINDCKVEGTSL